MAIRQIILVLAALQFLQGGQLGASTRLSNQERAIVFAIGEEARDFALEARVDVCVALGTDSRLNKGAIFAALRQHGLNFHPDDWCNRGPRGVTISITIPAEQEGPGTYKVALDIVDSDPIRLRGEHIATLLRRGTYVVKCSELSEPELEEYNATCCQNGKHKPETKRSPN